MTTVSIDVADAGIKTRPGDKIIYYAPRFRKNGSQVVSTAPQTADVSKGGATIEVHPGPLMVEFRCRNFQDSQPFRVVVPDSGLVTLADLLEKSYRYEPQVLSEIQQFINAAKRDVAGFRGESEQNALAAKEAQKAVARSASEAKKAASEAAMQAADAAGRNLEKRFSQINDEVRESKTSVESAAQKALQAEKLAKEYASGAKSGESAAQKAQRAAELARDKALASESAAGENAKTASWSVEQASAYEQGAKAAKAGLEEALAGVKEARSGAEQARDGAVEARSGAEQARDGAVEARSGAEQARDEAKRAAGEAAGSAATQAADKVREEVKKSTEKATSEANRAEQAAESAVVGIKPDTVKKSMLTEDLRGEIDAKADQSTVTEGLAKKANLATVTAQLAEKADKAVVEKQLGEKADSADVAKQISAIPKPTWEGLEGKPADFKPSAHTHATKEITGLDEALKAKADLITVDEKIKAIPKPVNTWGELQEKPAKFPPETHKHGIADVTGLQDALDEKTTQAYVDGKISSLPKPATSWSEITGKPDSFHPESHYHSTSDISGLDLMLQDKASSSHTHKIADITALQKVLSKHTGMINECRVEIGKKADKSEIAGMASKHEVQQLQATVNAAPKIMVVSQMPTHPDNSTIYLVR
ncbi:hypothetical protein [Corynebacterium diphtheriae]|uniref:hypothetical protein n=1 Tax=Corynebacterium diphtheriae TaxID=1717 RepID=UPI0002467E49|nr:hypothetical protein [Corynebacterium diphtheriae]AEX67288.1 extracellular matrix-binding protein ebhB [Corynebacterium diphtheriae C7 (beta)]UEB35846.1 hypothetical protein LK418_03430 [Corynebacterium diphtheriae subsp. diphtheriae]CAB1048660.1 hypothetical protein NCTC11397BIS_01078 [Corynebacterium diphtheriae]CKG89580.1 extracellular matrix-binding protein ebhB [Corynebacterium diphtheriae]